MRNFFSKKTEKIFAMLNIRHFKRLVIVLLAGFLVITSTACSPSPTNTSSRGFYNQRTASAETHSSTQAADRATEKRSYDSRLDRDSPKVKARAMAKGAQQSAEKTALNSKEMAENQRSALKDRADNFSEDVENNIERTKDDVVSATKRGVRNAKETAKDTSQVLQRTADSASRKFQEGTKDMADAARKTVNKTAGNVKDVVASEKTRGYYNRRIDPRYKKMVQ